ncbi:MAG TPA: hypothetical protein VGJ22_10175, partial [Anaerolineales bacterium]
MQTKKISLVTLFGLIILIGLILAGFAYMQGQYLTWRLQRGPLDLPVPAMAQSRTTSCGEAAFVMTHNYASPETPISEAEVIQYAEVQGYFTEDLPPFTSPANMVKIARHYTNDISTGSVVNASQGLALLAQR